MNNLAVDPYFLDQAYNQLQQANSVLLVTHVRPDGDAVGSLLGLGLAILAKGKKVQMVSEDGVPVAFKGLEGSQLIRTAPELPVDLIIVLDCSDRERTGKSLIGVEIPDWNIDHHVTNLCFARLNLVESKATATSEIVTEIIPLLGLSFSRDVSVALLTGLVTDTIGFQTSNMTPKTLRLAANLMELGANLPEIYRNALVQRSFAGVRFWGLGLSKIERDGAIVWTKLTLSDRHLAGYPGRDDADLINILASVEDAEIALIFVEQPKGRVKVSWRARPGLDVSQVALQFGGGGHAAAAGAEIVGNLAQVTASVLPATRLMLENKHDK
jgi:bifunctional oligoribonuclease and PAP phosphatase NrnA